MNKTQETKRIMPIRFKRLEVGSKFRIFAEPSRNIAKSKDQTIYLKEAESYSIAENEPSRACILDMEDLVVPLSRGGKARGKS